MKVDPKEIKNAGGNVENLKKIFQKKDPKLQKDHKKVYELIEHHSSRIDASIRNGLEQAKYFSAIDTAHDVSRSQLTYSFVRGLIDKNVGKAEVLELAKNWGLDDMLVPDEGGAIVDQFGRQRRNEQEKPGYKLNLPTFFNIFLPLVLSYVKIRWAKLYNDRDLNPFYKYEPVGLTMKQRLLCQILTNRVERMATDMGNREIEKQSIHGMLLYGQCLNFVRSAWRKDKQKINGKVQVVREGLEYAVPHITRTFWDESSPLASINTDTGVSWLGYWETMKYGDIYHNKSYWNRDRITVGMNGFWNSPNWNIYNKLYPCVGRFPDFSRTQFGSGVPGNDREGRAFNYTANEMDHAVTTTVMFDKIVPADWELYDYKYPVWHRFVYAGDRTVIYCEPIFYTPAVAYLYDHDANRASPSSLGLELLPFQDHLGNLLTQYILTVKKNLSKVVAVNTDIVSKDFLATLKNESENTLRGITYLPMSYGNMSALNQDIRRAFERMDLGALQPTGELVGCINMIISILERVLGFSPQEVGGSASHQQSATEVSITTTQTMARMQFTGTAVDSAIYARKVQMYEALLAYSTDKIMVDVADLTPDGARILEEAGFEVEMDPSTSSAGIIGDASMLQISGIASYKDGAHRHNDPQVASLMLTFFDRVASNPALIERAGIDWVVQMFNDIAEFFGLPLDFRLPSSAAQGPEQMQQSLQQMQEVAQGVVQEFAAGLGDSLRTDVQEPMQQMGQATQMIGEQVQNLEAKQAEDTEKLASLLNVMAQHMGMPMPGGV